MREFLNNYYADIVATVAILLSVGQIVAKGIKNRTSLALVIENVEQSVFRHKKMTIMLCTIINKSDAPISITRVMLTDKSGKEVSCHLRKEMVGERYYPKYPETDLPRTERIFSVQFPISLLPHGAVTEVIVFSTPEDVPDFQEGDAISLRFVTDKKEKVLEDTCKIHAGQILQFL